MGFDDAKKMALESDVAAIIEYSTYWRSSSRLRLVGLDTTRTYSLMTWQRALVWDGKVSRQYRG